MNGVKDKVTKNVIATTSLIMSLTLNTRQMMKATEYKGRLINHYEGTQGFNVGGGYRKSK